MKQNIILKQVHSHSNKGYIDKISEDSNGELIYDNKVVSGNATKLNDVSIDDSTRADKRMLMYNGNTGTNEWVSVAVAGIVNGTGNIIVPSGSPVTLTSGQEAMLIHPTATEDEMILNVKEEISGNTVSDIHVDFSDVIKYVFQDIYNIIFSSNKVQLKIDTIIPTMTSATTPKGVASASTYLPEVYPYLAFDGNGSSSNAWATNAVKTGWLKYQFENSKCITNYKILPVPTATFVTTRSPVSWTFEGSNDDISWTILDTRTAQTSWSTGTYKSYSFTNTTNYLYYRINITANGGDTYLQIAELLMLPSSLLTNFMTTSESSFNLTPIKTIESLSSTITTPTNTSVKCLFSVDNKTNWLYKDGTGIHKFTGDMAINWTSSNQFSELSTYFTNLPKTTLATDLNSLGITPVNLDLAFQLSTNDITVTPSIGKITLVYVTPQHTEYASYGSYDETTVRFGVKVVNDTTLAIKNLSTITRNVNVNVLVKS